MVCSIARIRGIEPTCDDQVECDGMMFCRLLVSEAITWRSCADWTKVRGMGVIQIEVQR